MLLYSYQFVLTVLCVYAFVLGGVSREDVIGKVASDILEKLEKTFDLEYVKLKLGGTPTPTQVVLLQELERFNMLIVKMGSSLKELQRALIGEVGMSGSLEALADALFNGFIPTM